MTYNIILSFFTKSSILKCLLLNHTHILHKITISSICFPLLRYIIRVLVSAPAIFIFHSTCRTRWCTSHQHEHDASHCHVVFHHRCCSSVVAPALCHLLCYMHHRVSRWSFFSKTEMDPQCRVVGQHHCVSCDFIENSGARDVSAACTFSYTATVCLLRHSKQNSEQRIIEFFHHHEHIHHGEQ